MKTILILLALTLAVGCSREPKPLPLYKVGQNCTVFGTPIQIIEYTYNYKTGYHYYAYTKDLTRHYFDQEQLECK